MAHFGDGLAVGPDLASAAKSAVAQACAPLEGHRPDLVCFFVSGSDPQEVEAAGCRVMELSGAGTTLGCSAEGVIGDGQGVELSSAVSVWAAVLPDVRATPFHLDARSEPDHEDGSLLAGMPEGARDETVALLLADPATFPIRAFIDRSHEALPGLPLVGGLVSSEQGVDGHRLFLQGKLLDGGAAGVLLGGDLSLRTVVSQGCRPVGPPMTVTKAEGNVIHELAGRPALTKLEEVVEDLPSGDRSLIRPAILLGIAMNEYADWHECGDFLVRSVVGADGEQGAVAIAEPVEAGSTVRMHVRDACTADAEMDQLFARFHADPAYRPAEGALLFSCNGRGSILFPSACHDVQAVRRGLDVTKVAGFFAAGEIGPVGGRNYLHGHTACVVAFGHRPYESEEVSD